jgi:hypothetical protein
MVINLGNLPRPACLPFLPPRVHAAFAAQSLLAALGSLQLVCNVFFAYFVNHEPVSAHGCVALYIPGA